MEKPESLLVLHSIVDQFRPDLEHYEGVYRDLHEHPELGQQEERTSRIAASHLREAGYQVSTNIGGYGLTGVLKNGAGPTVLLRADMDALPIREQTGLAYASTVEMVDTDGASRLKEKGGNDRADRYGNKRVDPSNTLFIGNIPFSATKEIISATCQVYGTITCMFLPTDRETGNLKGFAYVDFTTTEEATAALEALNGADIDGRPLRIEYAAARVDNGGGFGEGRGGGGREKKPVMHACGHDSHVACMMGVSTLLAKAKEKWKGTLIILFQPDEEHGAGARAMLDDGLYDTIPKPDIVLGQHLTAVKTGVVLIRPGVFMASADTFKVTIFGRGAHGAQPQDSIDPIVLAASIIMRLQTVVSREIGPEDVASVTCASIHGGKAHNVIPDEVEFTLNIRAFETNVREKVIKAVKRIIHGEAIASDVLRAPEVELVGSFPLTENDTEASLKLEETFKSYFGEDNTWEATRHTASEDFSLLASDIGVPSVFWNFGGVDAQKWEQFETVKDQRLIAKPHQANYAPVIEPTLKTGIDAMSLAALRFLEVVADD